MKVWIGVDDKPFEASTYRIISPINGENPLEIASLLDDNECDEIVVDNILEFIPFARINEYLSLLVSKLRHGGKLHIHGLDANEVNKAYYGGMITLEQYNNMIFGSKTHAWAFFQSITNIYEITQVLKSAGLKILNKRLPNFHYSISAERP